jgi:hypothetical protein
VFDFDAIGSDDWIGLVDVKLMDLINNAIPDEYALPSADSDEELRTAVIGKVDDTTNEHRYHTVLGKDGKQEEVQIEQWFALQPPPKGKKKGMKGAIHLSFRYDVI